MLGHSLCAQTPEEKLNKALTASQLFLAGAGGGHVAASSTTRAQVTKAQTGSYAGLLATTLLLEVTLFKRAPRKWKVAVTVGNFIAGALLANLAHNSVQRSRRSFSSLPFPAAPLVPSPPHR